MPPGAVGSPSWVTLQDCARKIGDPEYKNGQSGAAPILLARRIGALRLKIAYRGRTSNLLGNPMSPDADVPCVE
jgi:hypothetical protein